MRPHIQQLNNISRGQAPFIHSVWLEEVQRKVHSRHYYLRTAKACLRANEIGDMHAYTRLAEQVQIHIDEFTKYYDLENIRLTNK